MALGLAIAGCSEATANTDASTLAIQSLLVTGAPTQSVWVERLTPPDSSYSATVRPVPSSQVHLSLFDDAGTATAFQPVDTQPGRFTASVTVSAGGHYRLAGTVDGLEISAETTAPAPLDVTLPAGDTLHISRSACSIGCPVPLRWSSTGAVTLTYIQTPPDSLPAAFESAGTVTSDSAEMRLAFRRDSTSALTLTALNGDAAAFLTGERSTGNITGAFGYFGAASYRVLWIDWK